MKFDVCKCKKKTTNSKYNEYVNTERGQSLRFAILLCKTIFTSES